MLLAFPHRAISGVFVQALYISREDSKAFPESLDKAVTDDLIAHDADMGKVFSDDS